MYNILTNNESNNKTNNFNIYINNPNTLNTIDYLLMYRWTLCI